MGAASARRLAGLGYDVRVWNRSADKAEALAQTMPSITVAETARDAVETADLCIALLSTTDAVKAVVEELPRSFDAVLANLASGSPDDGRAVAAIVKEALPNAFYVDGAYCGPPSALEQGTGQLFVSYENGENALDARAGAALRALGVTTFCEGVGAARALDYAVVDMAFVTLMSYASNAAMLEEEGVSTEVAIEAIRRRLAAAPAALEAAAARMADRSDGAYESDPTATLATWRNFFDSRRPYLDAIGASRVLPDFCIDVLDRAGASTSRGHMDVTRVQEVLRYNDG